ncbi:CoA transferase [Nocardioides carbamazepini]|uniref:CaiB/BaiF CoA transferase family protein n=1 Tax=Nocardioides carbamazepini TaxID=2854259 RepID=UPI002149AE84|nr:CoA transferase [Nocardioides carbamazepini]MCR1783784.1 CoA transferase [Nocardioides carbamazepini]
MTHHTHAETRKTTTMEPGALDGLTVLDLTTVVMGPYATAMLGDLGAEVIKIESLDGDMSRKIGASRSPGMTALTMNLQRNKQSLALDLKSVDGREVLERLVAQADVVVTNLRPRSRKSLGLTYERLRQIRPDLILCTAQAYAEASERRDYPAYDDMVQAASGAAALAGRIDGSPRYAPYVVADKVSGLHIVIGILAAVAHRHSTGEGQHVEVPMVDTMIHFNLVEHFGGHTFDPPAGDFGWSRVLVPERTPYRTKDGFVCILPYSDANWSDFFEAAGLGHLAADVRFSDVASRHKHMGDLLAQVHTRTPQRTTEEWLELCRGRNIPAAALLELGNVIDDDYVREQRIVTAQEHPTEGAYFSTISPLRLSASPVRLRRHAPALGEDTVALLKRASYADDEVRALLGAGVVRAASDPPETNVEEAAR